MCWCRPEIRTPQCDRPGCHPPTKTPPRTLGEEQAYQDGKREGRRDALLTLGSAFGKVLEPDSLKSLASSLLDGLKSQTPYVGSRDTDPTEPASWPGRASQPPDVYTVDGCLFIYCPHPTSCLRLPRGCSTLQRKETSQS